MRRGTWIQITAVTLGCLPAAALGLQALRDDLGANPVEALEHATGEWTLRLLVLSLAVTPARRLLGWSWLAPLRRTVGLLAFGWACLHLASYAVVDLFLDWSAIVEDVLERRYVTAGFAAFLCLVPLAATSTDRMKKRLGRRWLALHRLVYLAAILGVLHFLWLVKGDDLGEPLVYAALLAALLGYRLQHARARLGTAR